MKHKIYIATSAFLFTSLLLLQGCGTADTRNTNTQKGLSSIDENNFLKISRYQYYRQSMISKNYKQSRSKTPGNKIRRAYPGQILEDVDKSILKVRTLKSSNDEIQRVLITQNNSKIEIKVTDDLVIVTYNNGKTTHKETFSKEEFSNINGGLI